MHITTTNKKMVKNNQFGISSKFIVFRLSNHTNPSINGIIIAMPIIATGMSATRILLNFLAPLLLVRAVPVLVQPLWEDFTIHLLETV